ncbi:MAG TPA: sterol desaturase family protein [Casimicrobiaceae bacterium]|nr:sterol desaturase family protein [Casimicrobiaceae bacterium]
MDAIDVLGLMVPVTYFVFLVSERLWPARQFPPRKAWQWLGIGFLVITGVISTVTPLLLPADWLAAHRWIDGTRLGIVGGTLLGFIALEGAIYAYHRAAHRFPALWRFAGHQVHHSPRRVDIPGSVLFHPLEMLVQVALQTFVTVIALGLDPLAAAIIGYLFAFYGMFQHWNVRTPQWLGYIIQRPESHCVHHRLGLHYYNFADLPLWDILFGTFRNPPQFMGECGFDGDADRKLGAMLAFADVNEPLYGPGSRGQKARREAAPAAG